MALGLQQNKDHWLSPLSGRRLAYTYSTGLTMLSAAEQSKLSYVAAMISHSNLGLDLPLPENLLWMRHGRDNPHVVNVESAVASISGHLIESDEMENIFYEEARGWLSTLSELGLEKARTEYPEFFKLYEDAIQC